MFFFEKPSWVVATEIAFWTFHRGTLGFHDPIWLAHIFQVFNHQLASISLVNSFEVSFFYHPGFCWIVFSKLIIAILFFVVYIYIYVDRFLEYFHIYIYTPILSDIPKKCSKQKLTIGISDSWNFGKFLRSWSSWWLVRGLSGATSTNLSLWRSPWAPPETKHSLPENKPSQVVGPSFPS